MTATIISFHDPRRAAGALSHSDTESSAAISAIKLELWQRHDQLLTIVEGLRLPHLAAHTRFGPLASDLESTVRYALVEVGLLIRQAEQLHKNLP